MNASTPSGSAVLRHALAERPHHLSPFLVLGDPDPETSLALCRLAVANGATMLELGLPYATPSADGPTVQRASARALASGSSTARCFEVLAAVRAACPAVPCNLLVYGNLVHARGVEAFCRDAAQAGASSLLVPDVPLEEGHALRAACLGHGIANVLLAGPRTPAARLDALAAAADGFVYLTGHQGVTGAHGSAALRAERVRAVAARTTRPLCVGFGLKSRDDVDATFRAGAAIAVVGSHLIQVVEHGLDARDQLPARFARAVRDLLPPSVPEPTSPCS